MANAFFISAQKLKDNTNLDDNVTDNQCLASINLAQDLNIHQTLGTKLYDKIQSLINTGDITGATNSDYKYLLDTHIVPTTIQYAYYYSLDALLVKAVNAGLVQAQTEQGSSIDNKTFRMMKDNVKNQAEFYDDRMRDYLSAESQLFPEYTNWDDEDLPPNNNSSFTSSIVVPNKYPRIPDGCKYLYYDPTRIQGYGRIY